MKSLRIAVVVWLMGCYVVPSGAEEPAKQSSKETPRSILTLEEVLARVERGHPLLQGSQTQKIVASGKILKALGTFEPRLVNDWELERLASSAGTTTSVGFNDTFLEFRHPWGVQGFAGFRAGIGDVRVADLGMDSSNQPLLGIMFPLLRGLITNPAHAELKKSELATKQAQLEIQQTRQDLYRGAAMQYWNWVAAHKFMELQEKAVTVAETRSGQLTRQAKAGARAEFDAIEANQEVQRRRATLIKARRTLEREQLKLALFIWEGDNPVVVGHFIPPERSLIRRRKVSQPERDKKQAVSVRPEIQLVHLEAKLNHIDLEVADNNFLPNLNAVAQPTRKPGEFVLGLGYRFGVQMSLPFLQRHARGDRLQIEGKAQRLKFMQQYRIQQVSLDVDNAQSAVDRARERIQVSRQALDLAQALEKGERTRFRHGATSLVFVNLRERNVIQAAEEWITALADYQKALALYQWAIGQWVNGPSTA